MGGGGSGRGSRARSGHSCGPPASMFPSNPGPGHMAPTTQLDTLTRIFRHLQDAPGTCSPPSPPPPFLCGAWQLAIDWGMRRIVAQGDSQLVVCQVRGEFKTRSPRLVGLRGRVLAMTNDDLQSFDCFHIIHCDRCALIPPGLLLFAACAKGGAPGCWLHACLVRRAGRRVLWSLPWAAGVLPLRLCGPLRPTPSAQCPPPPPPPGARTPTVTHHLTATLRHTRPPTHTPHTQLLMATHAATHFVVSRSHGPASHRRLPGLRA